MAEATDRPQGTGEVPSRTSLTPAGQGLSAWPERADMPSGELGAMPPTASESYRPLSLLALVAFGMAVLYVLVVLVGGAFALVNHTPCLMPTWTFLLPLAVLVLCWAARNRIRNAEGTLSGLAFTVWGVRLTVVVGLSYLAYYGFTFFAVRLQAQDYADQFFEQLKQGRSERAFLMAVGSLSQEDDAALRDRLEVRFNSPSGPSGSPGPFTQFRQSQFVRTIEMSGAETRIEPKGVIDWSYGKGGYQVVLKYRVSTPMAEFDMSVETFGRDSKPGEPKGRQWQIMMQKGETAVLPASVKLTSLGKDFMKKAAAGQNFAMLWQEKIARQQWDEVYLDTLEPNERERMSKGRKAADALRTIPFAGLAPLGLCDETCREFLKGRQTLAEGKLIHLDDKKFWTSKVDRAAIMQRLQQTFRPEPEGRPLVMIRPQPTLMPLSRSGEGRLNVLFDAQFTYLDEETSLPKYVAEGYVVASAEDGDTAENPSGWHIQAIEFNSARTAPTRPDRPRQPGDLGQPGPRGGL